MDKTRQSRFLYICNRQFPSDITVPVFICKEVNTITSNKKQMVKKTLNKLNMQIVIQYFA